MVHRLCFDSGCKGTKKFIVHNSYFTNKIVSHIKKCALVKKTTLQSIVVTLACFSNSVGSPNCSHVGLVGTRFSRSLYRNRIFLQSENGTIQDEIN